MCIVMCVFGDLCIVLRNYECAIFASVNLSCKTLKLFVNIVVFVIVVVCKFGDLLSMNFWIVDMVFVGLIVFV